MCFYVLLGLIAPRVALFLTWLFRREWVAILDPWWVGILGFVFLPFTTLAYVLIHAHSGQVDGIAHLIIMLAALLADLGVWRRSSKTKVVVRRD